jgi:hypothetical protein
MVTINPTDNAARFRGRYFLIDGLPASTSYMFYVTASNQVGTSIASTEFICATTIPIVVPDAPLLPICVTEEDTAISVTWEDGVFDGGSPITHYNVIVEPTGNPVEG